MAVQDDVANDVQEQFAQIGKELKEQLLKDFNEVLQKDSQALRSEVAKLAAQQQRSAISGATGAIGSGLSAAISESFGGSGFGAALGSGVSGLLSKGLTTGKISGRDFRLAAGQSLLALGSAVGKGGRNG